MLQALGGRSTSVGSQGRTKPTGGIRVHRAGEARHGTRGAIIRPWLARWPAMGQRLASALRPSPASAPQASEPADSAPAATAPTGSQRSQMRHWANMSRERARASPSARCSSSCSTRPGCRGKIGTRAIGNFRYKKTGQNGADPDYEVKIFPLLVQGQSATWPEHGQRVVQWVDPEKAISLIREPEMKAIVAKFAKRASPRNDRKSITRSGRRSCSAPARFHRNRRPRRSDDNRRRQLEGVHLPCLRGRGGLAQGALLFEFASRLRPHADRLAAEAGG